MELFPPALEVGLALATICFLILASYRLYLSPLAKFPGPKLAALTQWVEAYYEILYGEGGQFMFKYREWHKRYGPIIRINPWEIHIQDASFLDVLYSNSLQTQKLPWLAHRFNSPDSVFSAIEHHVHRQRRGSLNPFFSKRKIADRAPLIQDAMDRLCARLERDFVGSGRVLNVDDMWGCFTSDVIVEYAFEQRFDFMETPDLRSDFTHAMINLLEPVHVITQFPAMLKAMKLLPDWVLERATPQLAVVNNFNRQMTKQIMLTMESREKGEKKADTIFNAILDANLPESEISVKRLQSEAIGLTGGAIETTMRALAVATYHILANSNVKDRLAAELTDAIPDALSRGTGMPTWDSLMQLPYLTAVINEALRLSYGITQRMPRIIPKSLQYKDWYLPAGTIASMDPYAISHDEEIFPDSFNFVPNRWLGDPKAPDGKQLTRYLASFGRGTRSCVGMQLAYAELYIGIATLFRRLDFELFETDRGDIDGLRDRFVPRPRLGSKGVRALVHGSKI